MRRLDEAGEFSNSGILSLYQRQACAADAIVTGHSSISMSHMSEFQTSVDSDNDFAIDSVIKGNSTAAIRGRSDIVMTSVGGALSLPAGQVTFDHEEFPQLQPGNTYLIVLRYIPVSSSFKAIVAWSTLLADISG